MTTEAVSPVPVALGSAATGTEEGRAFFQERLGLYAMWGFVLSGFFYVLNVGLAIGVAPGYFFAPSFLAHFGATGTAGLLWGLTRTLTFSYRTLVWMDNVGLILMCGLFALMGAELAIQHVDFVEDPVHALLLGQMACMKSPERDRPLGTRSRLPPQTRHPPPHRHAEGPDSRRGRPADRLRSGRHGK